MSEENKKPAEKKSATRKAPAKKTTEKKPASKKFVYLPKNLECKIIDDSHSKFLTIQIGESEPIMVRKSLVQSK